MKIYQFEVGQMKNFTYVIEDTETKNSVIIDPSWNLERIKKIIFDNDLTIKYIINTHTHFDHIHGNNELAQFTGAKIIQHRSSEHIHDISVIEGSTIEFGNSKLTVMYTPGHSQDSICLITKQHIFSGDTIFIGSCGRTDLPGGNTKELYNSIYRKISPLDKKLILYPGHNYSNINTSTIEYEKHNNIIFQCKTETDFLNIFNQ